MNVRLLRVFAHTLLAVSATAVKAEPVATILIENVTIVSAHLDVPKVNRDIVIANGRIRDVVRTGTDIPAIRRIDGRGKILIPGLIDSHVHLAHNPILNREDRKRHQALHRQYRRQLPRSFLYHGFTSVIDLDYSARKAGWLPGTSLAPEVYHCGRGIRVAGGYGPAFVPPEFVHKAFPNMVFEERHRADWPEQMDPDDYTIDAAVDRVVQSGAICLKTYVESGFGGTFDWPSPSHETLLALSEAARDAGLVYVVHANGAGDWQQAIAGGADVIAHGLWHWDGDRRSAGLGEQSRSAIASAVVTGVAVQPTLRVVEGERSTLTWNIAEDPRIPDVLSADLLHYLRSEKGRWSQDFLLGLYHKHNPHPDTPPLDLINVSIRRATDSMVRFHRDGGTLLLGSDTPAQDGIGNPPGLNGYLEMASWAQAGIPLETIFSAATLGNARAFNLDDQLGSIEPGKQADLLLLNSNPLEDVAAYDDISVVIINGHAIDRQDLSANALGSDADPKSK